MSITITVENNKKIFTNDNAEDIITYIDETEKYIKNGFEINIRIFNPDTTDFHIYEFEYKTTSPLTPRKWILNNILYSLCCKETLKIMPNHLLPNITSLLYYENKK